MKTLPAKSTVPPARRKAGAIYKHPVARNGNVWNNDDQRHATKRAGECVDRPDLVALYNAR